VDQFITGWLGGIACGVILMLLLNDTTDDRMRNVEEAMAERAFAKARIRERRMNWLKRGKKLWLWS